MSSVKSPRLRMQNSRVMEIFERVLMLKEKHNVPYSVSIKRFGFRQWSSFKVKAEKIMRRSTTYKVICKCGHEMFQHSPFDKHHCWICECSNFEKIVVG